MNLMAVRHCLAGKRDTTAWLQGIEGQKRRGRERRMVGAKFGREAVLQRYGYVLQQNISMRELVGCGRTVAGVPNGSRHNGDWGLPVDSLQVMNRTSNRFFPKNKN